MRKCVSCGQWLGHVLCLKGHPEQCVDCAVVPLQHRKPSPRPDRSVPPQATNSAECTCAVCVAKSSPNASDASSSRPGRPSRKLMSSTPQRAVKHRRKSLTVSIPQKRLQHSQHKGLKITSSIHSFPEKKGQVSVHPIIKALSRKHPNIKVLNFIRLPLYSPRQLLDLHKPGTLLPKKQVGVEKSAEIEPIHSDNQSQEVKSSQPCQSETSTPVETRQQLSLETKSDEGIKSRDAYAFSPLLQKPFDHTVCGSPKK